MKIKVADDVPAKPVEMPGAEGCQIRLLIHNAEGAENFHMRQFTVAPGGHTPWHTHEWEHELYVLAGSGVVVTADGEVPLSPGQCVYVEPGEQHQFRNTGDGEMKFLCLVPKCGSK